MSRSEVAQQGGGLARSLDAQLAGRDVDVFDELADLVRLRRLAGLRELELLVRAADEYEIVDDDLFMTDDPMDAALGLDRSPASESEFEVGAGATATRGRVLGGERWVPAGAAGTPNVGEFLALELAGIFACSVQTARARLANALNLRHRHPRLWDAMVHDHAIQEWQAVSVASDCASAGLSQEACLTVDAELAAAVALLGWTRARRLVKGLIVRADPVLAAQRAEERRCRRGVWTGPLDEGQVFVEARLDAGDGVVLEAQIARIAELLAADGDDRDRQQRRATALAMMAIPHVAAAYLEDHAGSDVKAAPVTRVDPEKLRPRVNLVVHLAAGDLSALTHDDAAPAASGVARVEGHGAADVGSVRRLLAGCHVTVRPVVDLNQPPATDAYEIPDRLREHVIARNPVEVFPWSAVPSRACQLDHTAPYRHGPGRRGPTGDAAVLMGGGSEAMKQTRAGNLGPLGATAHRAKTHGDWHLIQPEPGVFHWRSRAGFEYEVTPYGTIALGRSPDAPRTPTLHGGQAGNRPPPHGVLHPDRPEPPPSTEPPDDPPPF